VFRICEEDSNPQDWWDNRGVFYRSQDAINRAQELADREDTVFHVRAHKIENPTIVQTVKPRIGG